MCLIVLANNVHPNYKLIFAANRDEFYNRPSEQAEFWNDHPDLLAGKDLRADGTWLGITKQGRFAAITNFRDLKNHRNDAPSRGKLTLDFLISSFSTEDYYNNLKPSLKNFNGFNLLLGSVDELYYFSNKTSELQKIESGVHGISNAILDTPWHKVEKSKNQLIRLLDKQDIHPREVLNILDDSTVAKDEELPDTGVGLELERVLSSVFIKSEKYGTRSSTVIIVDKNNRMNFVEKTYFANTGRFSNKEYNFTIKTNRRIMEEKVIHEKDKKQFIISIDDKECYVEYNMENNTMNLHHTYTDPDLRGKGLAAKVVIAAFEYAKSNNLKVIPGCTYVQSFITKHKEYDDLLAD